MSLTVGSLFAGIGGFDLAAEWMGWRTIWVSEIDPYASAVLAHRFPEAPNLGDITKIDWSVVETPDVMCGGFPCVEVSSAGKKRGIHHGASSLWKEYIRAVETLRPPYLVLENSWMLYRRGWSEIANALSALGYRGEVGELSACAVGAPHARRRLFALAYTDEYRKPTRPVNAKASWLCADASRVRHGWNAKPRTLRMADGISRRVDRHRVHALGNAIVPQCAVEGPFRRIQELEGQTV